MWLTVGMAYAALLALGVLAGRYLASRAAGRDGGGLSVDVTPPPPAPPAPTFGAEWEPLGSDFDRALLPGVTFGADRVDQRA